VQRLQEEIGISVRERVVGNAEEAEQALTAFAARGVSNLLTVGFSNTPAVKAAAKQFPETRFTIIDGVVEQSNVRSVLFREDHAGFLAGAAAGLKTESDTLGFLGGMAIPPIERYGCGFLQGARAVNPDAEVLWRYIGDSGRAFRNARKASEMARALVADGADIVFTAAGFAGTRALKAATEAGALGVGVDVNQNDIVPGKILTSAVKRVDRAVYISWKAASEGNWEPGLVRLGLDDGGVAWAVDQHNKPLVRDIMDRVNALGREIANDERSVKAPAAMSACGPRRAS
jgi:basic membrane protein A